MTNDPWADEPAVQAPPTTTQAPAPAKSAAVREQAPANEGITVTLKGGKGYEAPWIVVHAADPASALAQLNDPTLKDLADLTAKVGGYFAGKGAQTPAAGPSGPAPSAPTGGSRPAHQQAPGGESRYCNHGEMEFRSAVSKAGKPYKGFFCTERNRDEQCQAQFLR